MVHHPVHYSQAEREASRRADMKATTQKVSEEEEAKQRPKAKKFAPCTHSQNEKRCPRALLRVEDRSNKWLPLHLQMCPAGSEGTPPARPAHAKGMLCLQGKPGTRLKCLLLRRSKRSQHRTTSTCSLPSWARIIQPHMPSTYAQRYRWKKSQVYILGILSGQT